MIFLYAANWDEKVHFWSHLVLRALQITQWTLNKSLLLNCMVQMYTRAPLNPPCIQFFVPYVFLTSSFPHAVIRSSISTLNVVHQILNKVNFVTGINNLSKKPWYINLNSMYMYIYMSSYCLSQKHLMLQILWYNHKLKGHEGKDHIVK